MESIKKESLKAIKKLPETSNIDEIMYRLYVIEKIRKGTEAISKGKVISIEKLKKEIKSW